MKEEYAEALDADTEQLLDRWEGAPEHFAEDVFRVRDKSDGRLVDLELFYPYQPQLLHAYFYGDEKIVNVYKGRRIGVSFIFGLAVAIEALSIPESNYAIVSRTKSQAEERIADIKELLKTSRLGFDDLDQDLIKNNKGYIILPNGAEVRAFSGDPDAARGFDSARKVFIDEMAFIDAQKETTQAFMPFINLVPDGQMLQVSTPKVSNDTFMETHQRGSKDGAEGVISIKQPSFANADDIDPEVSLYEQVTEPVRPDFNLDAVEAERAQDPEGFAQEYLCRPISDEYRFFTSAGVSRAQRRGAGVPDQYDSQSGTGGGKATNKKAYWHPATHARLDGMMIMGVDIATGVQGGDDTALAVFEHAGDERFLRFHSIVDHQDLNALGVHGDPANPSDLAEYIWKLSENMGIDKVFLDKTGPGMGFRNEINRKLGKRASGFNFSDKDTVAEMMGDFNYLLHNNLITLVPDKRIKDQLESIVKKKNHESSKPKFSGKKYAREGKDDLAMAMVLGACPPNFNADGSYSAHQRDGAYGQELEEVAESEGEFRGAKQTSSNRSGGTRRKRNKRHTQGMQVNLSSSDRRPSSNYNSRHDRRRKSR